MQQEPFWVGLFVFVVVVVYLNIDNQAFSYMASCTPGIVNRVGRGQSMPVDFQATISFFKFRKQTFRWLIFVKSPKKVPLGTIFQSPPKTIPGIM